MANDVVAKKQDTNICGRAHKSSISHRIDNPARADAESGQFFKQIKIRFGDANDKEKFELEELISQFYRIRRILSIHHELANYKQPPSK